MSDSQFNPALKSIVLIRNVVKDIDELDGKIMSLGKSMDEKLETAFSKLAKYSDLKTTLLEEKQNIEHNVDVLNGFLKEVSAKLRKREAKELDENFKERNMYVDQIGKSYQNLFDLGNTILMGDDLKAWKELWEGVFKDYKNIKEIAETYGIQLKLIQQLAPEEIDELTNDILKHIPLNYTLEDAEKYQKEYTQAYNELQEEMSHKKNLWDRVLDILAGGIQETPAHRVAMRRWMDGNS